MLSALLRRYWRPLAGALAMLAITGAILVYGSRQYDKGISDERARQAAHAVNAAQSRGEVDQAVGRLPDGTAADELRKHWSRD